MSESVEELSDEALAQLVADEDTSHSDRRAGWDEMLERGYHHPREVLE